MTKGVLEVQKKLKKKKFWNIRNEGTMERAKSQINALDFLLLNILNMLMVDATSITLSDVVLSIWR